MEESEADAMRDAIAAITRAYTDAMKAINATSDSQQALESATQLAVTLREAFDGASELRTQIAGRIWEAEKLSLSALANRMGVSKARADQLIRAHKSAREESAS